MDPLSITASIIGIIGGVSATYKIIRTVKGLPKAFDEVQNDLPLVLRTLRSAQDRLCDDQEITEDERNDVVAILQPIHDKAQELQRVFDEVKKECENDKDSNDWVKVRSVYHKALRGMKASRVEQLMKDILGGMKKLALSQAFKSASQHDMKTLEETLEKAIRDISNVEPSLPDSEFDNDGQIFASQQNAPGAISQQNNVQWGTNTFISGENNISGSGHNINLNRVEVQQCLRDLRVTDPRDDKKRIEDTKGGLLADSYRWVLDNTTFQQWQQDPNSRLLWVKGDPGKGKTMLLCGIINELQGSMPQSALLSYFFCQATDARINSATAVLRGLLHMLLTQQPSLASHVRKKHDQAGKAIFEDANAWVVLVETFEAVLHDPGLRMTYLIIDALDECVADLPKLLEFVAKQSSASSRVKWIVSSRNWPDIEAQLEQAGHKVKLSLELNAQSVAAAVDIFIQRKVDQLAQEKRYKTEVRHAVLQHLKSNANDTFLWVALVCQDLKTTPKWNVLKKLALFPPGLDSLYKRMIDQISESDSTEICLQVLASTAILYRPVSVPELVALVEQLEDLDDLESVREVIGFCGSFLTLREDTVYFVHQSAKDFLFEKAYNEAFPDGSETVHWTILSRSLGILSRTLHRDMYSLEAPGYPIKDVKPPKADPLAVSRYPCICWIDHLCDLKPASLENRVDSVQVLSAVKEFLREKYLYWLEGLSLCKSIEKGVLSMEKLWSLVQEIRNQERLAQLVQDARRFIMYHKGAIEGYPLQTYISALMFSPTGSLIRQLFQHEEPEAISIRPILSEGWSACLQTLEGHSGGVCSVAFSHDSAWLASASGDETIKIWVARSGECVRTLEGHSGGVCSVAFSHDSAWLASASGDETIKIWVARSGECVRTLEGHSGGVCSVAFSHDSAWLASASDDGTVKIWDARSIACIQTLVGHRDRVLSVAFAHDSAQVASASFDNTVKIWDVNSGVCIQTLDHSDWVDSVAFSHDSALLASASHDGTVKIWDARSSECIQTLVGHTHYAGSVAFSHDSTRIASGSFDDKIKIWDVKSGECSQTFKGHSNMVGSVAFSHDSGHLASASGDGTIKIWDTSSEVCLQEPEGHSNSVTAIALSPNLTKVVSASYDDTVKIWDTGSGECLQTHDVSGETIQSIALSSDSKWVVLGPESDSNIMILDASSGECVRMLEGHSKAATSIVLCPNSKQVASASYDNTVRIWDIITGQCLQTLSIGEIIFDISFDATGTYLHTEIGSFIIDASNASSISDTAPRVMSPKSSLSEGMALSSDGSWITYDSENLIWLPSEYRPSCSAVLGKTIGIGAGTGRVWICKNLA
ncbi:unnamed protein product [Alternaria alternata]